MRKSHTFTANVSFTYFIANTCLISSIANANQMFNCKCKFHLSLQTQITSFVVDVSFPSFIANSGFTSSITNANQMFHCKCKSYISLQTQITSFIANKSLASFIANTILSSHRATFWRFFFKKTFCNYIQTKRIKTIFSTK